jgi:hypothetical protein
VGTASPCIGEWSVEVEFSGFEGCSWGLRMRGNQDSHVQYDSVHSTHVADSDELTISFPRLLMSSQDMLCHR